LCDEHRCGKRIGGKKGVSVDQAGII